MHIANCGRQLCRHHIHYAVNDTPTTRTELYTTINRSVDDGPSRSNEGRAYWAKSFMLLVSLERIEYTDQL